MTLITPVIYSMMLLLVSGVSLTLGLFMYLMDIVLFIEWELVNVYSVCIVYVILFDWMSLMFSSVVMFISSMVLIYSGSYMSQDSSLNRFIYLVYLFVISMMLMILSPNMISILLGWDGLGLVSYALVIYYQNSKSAGAGMITVLSNRVGDVAILVSISWMFNFGSWDFFYYQFILSVDTMKYLVPLVVLAAMTKSAQLPFSAWLPAAMAAPTPVSSLVHSSTLVTAGVYILIRFNEVLGVNLVLTVVAVSTLFMAGLGANYEYDLKKIIALSTLSQLGVMMMVLSIGLYELAFFHLISHAMFKSLLFLCAGSYIHSLAEVQDIRMLSKALFTLPMTSIYFVGCSFSLCGFPFLAGFYSKDLILESYFFMEMNLWLWGMLLMGTFFTITYSMRLFFYMYLKNSSVSSIIMYENELMMLVPMSALFVVSLVVGVSFSWGHIIPVCLALPLPMKCFVPVIGVICGVMVLYTLTRQNVSSSLVKVINFQEFTGQMWFLPFLTSLNFIKTLVLGKAYYSWMDAGWLEILGGQGGISYVMKMSLVSDKINIMYFKSYTMIIMLLIISLVIIF